jgi:hypothetical protein
MVLAYKSALRPTSTETVARKFCAVTPAAENAGFGGRFGAPLHFLNWKPAAQTAKTAAL